VICTKLPVETS
jgi:isopenicillin N synthase-like dioxygenase